MQVMTADGLIKRIWRQSCQSWRSAAREIRIRPQSRRVSAKQQIFAESLTKRDFKALGSVEEVTLMPENALETIERLETFAAWHRISAERAGADWVWEARLRTAEDLERQAAENAT
jgi:hypothetical protein